MNQRQHLFALATGTVISIVGSMLATNAVTDWSLATVGMGLIALAGIQSLQQASSAPGRTARNANASLQLLQPLR